METWYKVSCPYCKCVNWLGNAQDITSYTCYVCSTIIRLYSGEFGEEYAPHVEGSMPWDDEAEWGSWVQGQELPG